MSCTPQFDSTVIDQTKLEKLAITAVRVGLNVQHGQEVIIGSPIEAAPLARLITAEAYKAGAKLVTTFYSDEESTLLRYKHATDESFDYAPGWLFNGMGEALKANTARISIIGDNPFLLNGQDVTKVARANKARSLAAKPVMEPITNFDVNWSIVSYPTRAWAKVMFPLEDETSAIHKLAEAIFSISRLDGNPIENWKNHSANLARWSAWLNQRNFSALHFKAPGTDLTVGLADGHAWEGGESVTTKGIICNANIPSEEVFTTPHAHRVNGIASSTKPLSYNGMLIQDIQVRFENGKIVEAHASKGEAVLKQILETDEGASRLGEVALVPHSSPISQSGMLFYETLFDENAACHIALGQCYTKCFKDGNSITEEEVKQRGGNQSMIHIDWMIGCGEMDVDGIHQDGSREPVMRNGEFCF